MKLKTLFSLVVLTLFTPLIPAMHAQTFSVIHAFTGTGTEGGQPFLGVTIKGNALYGTANFVYQLTNTGSSWQYSTIALRRYGFGYTSRVVFGPDGHLYGTSDEGGTFNGGSVSNLKPQVGPCSDAACYWTITDLHDFGSGTDGNTPYLGDLIFDQQGNIYGTTELGGTFNTGTVYELTPSGNGYTESVLYNFSNSGGLYPLAGLVFDNNGNLFGTTSGGFNLGTVFELTDVPGVGWMEHTLYTFQGNDGSFPFGGLIFDSAGNLYGTTVSGGSGGGGTVFELSPSGNTWTFKLLYSFSTQNNQYLCGPEETLTMDGAGSLYGTTYCDGANSLGNVFKLTHTGNGWEYTSLHDFTGGADGNGVAGGVAIDTDGTLYGTAQQGGDYGLGTVWMIKP